MRPGGNAYHCYTANEEDESSVIRQSAPQKPRSLIARIPLRNGKHGLSAASKHFSKCLREPMNTVHDNPKPHASVYSEVIRHDLIVFYSCPHSPTSNAPGRSVLRGA